MTQMALFDNLSSNAFPAGNVRQKQIDAALRHARDVWREHYESFILEYAADATEPFTAEDVRERYRATPGRAQTDAEQASGGIFQRLVKTNRLRIVGVKRSRVYGNNLTAYLKW